jgi:hypothetical protein
MLAAALRYALADEYSVIPCDPATKRPMHERGLIEHGVLDATRDPDLIRSWWTRWPEASIGIALGLSGLAGIDVDNPDAAAAYAALALPTTRTVTTGRDGGGRHYYFNLPTGMWFETFIPVPGLEIRSGNAYLIAPPSRHRTGRTYVADNADVASLDAASVARLQALVRPDGRPLPLQPVFHPGSRHAELARMAGHLRRPGFSEGEMLAALREANRTRCSPSLTDADVKHIAASIAKKAPAEALSVGTPQNHSLGVQSWCDFDDTAGESVPCLVNGLWPEGAHGMIGAAPKAGKTWLGMEIAVSVATGTPVFGSFPVPSARPVLYVALEGHRAAIRSRIGCIARGHGVRDPIRSGLSNLHLTYKPKGINLADGAWADALVGEARALGAALVVIDVLRRAARIQENAAGEFMALIDLLSPLAEHGVSVALLHHFVKTSEETRGRTPGERLAGTGAMFGALDVGLFITKSENHARKLTIHTDIRDLAAPDSFVVTLLGDGSGPHGGFAYRDELRLVREDLDPDDKLAKGKARDIAAFVIDGGGTATPGAIRSHFDLSEQALKNRRERLEELGVDYILDGRNSRYQVRGSAAPRDPVAPRDTGNHGGAEAHPVTPPPYRAGRGDHGDGSGRSSEFGEVVDHGVESGVPDHVLDHFSLDTTTDEYYEDLHEGAWGDGSALAETLLDAFPGSIELTSADPERSPAQKAVS